LKDKADELKDLLDEEVIGEICRKASALEF
jgi:hypothetical protein